MLIQTRFLTPKRRVILAWGLIFVALLCQITRDVSLANIFILFAAGVGHEMLVGRTPSRWEGPLLKVGGWCLFLVFFVIVFFRLLPLEKILYVIYPLVAVFLIWGLVNDIRWLRSARDSESEPSNEP